MIDKVTIERIKLLHPKLRDEVMDLYVNKICPALGNNVMCRFAYTLRTFKEQDELFQQGRTKLFDAKGNRLGKITNAKGGQSLHNYGLALDIVLITNGKASWDTAVDFDKDGTSDWMEVVTIFKQAGWKWGGDWTKFPDKPHFEKTWGWDWKKFLERYNAGLVDKEGYVVL